MRRLPLAATLVSTAVVSTLVAAPAQGLEMKVRNETCRVSLSSSEEEAWERAGSEDATINPEDYMPFEVEVRHAADAKRRFVDAMEDELHFRKLNEQDRLDAGILSEEEAKTARSNIKQIKAMEDLRSKYESAMDSCAKSQNYASSGTKSDGSTSSEMNDATLYTLLGLLGLAGLTAAAAFLQNGLPALPQLKLPF